MLQPWLIFVLFLTTVHCLTVVEFEGKCRDALELASQGTVGIEGGVVTISNSKCKVIAGVQHDALTVAQLLVEYCYPIAAQHKQGLIINNGISFTLSHERRLSYNDNDEGSRVWAMMRGYIKHLVSGIKYNKLGPSILPTPVAPEVGCDLFDSSYSGVPPLSSSTNIYSSFLPQRSGYVRTLPVLTTCLQSLTMSRVKFTPLPDEGLRADYVKLKLLNNKKVVLERCQRDARLAGLEIVHRAVSANTVEIYTSPLRSDSIRTVTRRVKRSSEEPYPLPDCAEFEQVEVQEGFNDQLSIKLSGPLDKRYLPKRSDGSLYSSLVALEEADNMEFTDQEAKGADCGGEVCVACTKCNLGECVTQQCADRMVSPRMKVRLELLLNLAEQHLPDEVIIIEEGYEESGSEDYAHDEDSLHYEGRAVILKLLSGNETSTLLLSKLAQCSLFNDVQLTSGLVMRVTVQKCDQGLTFQSFPFMYMAASETPDTEYEGGEALLYDSTVYTDYPMTDTLRVGDFVQKHEAAVEIDCPVTNARYFRLSSIITECLDLIEKAFAEEMDMEDEEEAPLVIQHGYMTQAAHHGMVTQDFLETIEGRYFSERDALDNSEGRRKHASGRAVLFSTPLEPLEAATIVIKTVGPLLRTRGLYMGIALHNVSHHPCNYYNREGIYLDVREEENAAWVTYDDFFTGGARITTEYFSEQVEAIFAKLPYYITPYSGAAAIVPPQAQGAEYMYIPPGQMESIKEDPCVVSDSQREAFIISPEKEQYDYGEYVRFACRNGRKLWLPQFDDGFAETYCAYGELDDVVPEMCNGDFLDDFDTDKNPKKGRQRVKKRSLFGKSSKDIEHERWCNETEPYRKETTEALWKIVKRRPSAHDKLDVREELEQCFWHLCGNRRKGKIWKQKVHHCSNFLHWIPTPLEGGEDTALHHAQDIETTRLACGSYCLERTELYSMMSNLLNKRYKSLNDSTLEMQLYSEHMNPLPVLQIVEEMFAMTISGSPTIYIKKSADIGAMEDVLKALMTYNEGVEEVVFGLLNQTKGEEGDKKYDRVHLKETNRVYNSLQRMVSGWTRIANPNFARDTVAPFRIEVVTFPPEDLADIADTDKFVQNIRNKRDWEFKWLEKLRN